MSEFIRVAQDGHGFVEGQTSRRFVPFGCNYFDPKVGWAPKIWSRYDHQTVQRQLGQVAGVGLNCIRVFLDVSTLNPQPGQFSEEGFAKVDDMVAVARGLGIRIIFSGPNMWEGRSGHLSGDHYVEPAQMDFLCQLWTRLAQRYGDEPAVMTWDLRNEPMVGWLGAESHRWISPEARTAAWKAHAKTALGIEATELPASTGAGVERRVYVEYLQWLEGLATNWVKRQCQALRQAGARQMISVGLIQWSVPVFLPEKLGYSCFNPRKIESELDYMSVHFYPMQLRPTLSIEQEMDLQRAYLQIVSRAAYVPGKPLVMEEFGWKGGKLVPRDPKEWPQEYQTLWGDVFMESTGRLASGWLNWGYADAADPNADISAASGLWTQDEQLKHWGRRLADYAARWKAKPPAYQPADKTWRVNLTEFLLEHAGHPKLAWLEQRVQADPSDNLEMVFED